MRYEYRWVEADEENLNVMGQAGFRTPGGERQGPLTVGSLFSGIAGIDLGLERAGMSIAWSCEIDPDARAVLKRHWPDVPCYEDVKLLTKGGGADGRPPADVDVLCGGFP